MKTLTDAVGNRMPLVRIDRAKSCSWRSLTQMLGCVLILSAFSAPALAQTRPIEIEQSTIQPTIQMGRPIPSWWEVKIQGSALMEGRIEFLLRNESRVLATVSTEDLALTGPQQRIRVMLPPINDRAVVDQLVVDARFKGKRLQQDLGTHILRVAQANTRAFMSLTSIARLAPKRSKIRDRILTRLSFESLAPNLEDAVKTIRTSLEPADLPQEPMGYCAYEIVILFGDEFRLLRKPQLDALAAWVKAGGSLYLEPTGVLESYHVEFLRSLAEFGPSDLVIQPDSQGRLIPGTIWNDARLMRLTNGLGRIVLRIEEEAPAGDDDDAFSVETPDWREVSAFLWRLHSDQVQILRNDPLAGMNQLLGNYPQAPQFGMMAGNRLMLKPPSSTTELVNRLMPDGVRMVPLWVLGVILTGFVIWIGPVDYFGLGWLRARKFTWLTFPLATFLVTALTVWITNQYMSTAETRRGLELRDLGDDGSVVRTNRFELLFIASTRQVTTSIRKGVFTDLATGTSIDDSYNRIAAPRRYATAEVIERRPPRLQGRIPTEFTATQDMAKWTPQLNRMFWIPGASESTKVDWSAFLDGISLQEMFNNNSIPSALATRIREKFGINAMMAVIGSEGRWAYDRESPGWTLRGASLPNNYNNSNIYMGEDDSSYAVPAGVRSQPDLFRWLYQYSVGTPYGLFSLRAQVGPAGGPDMDDLPILDSSDKSQLLLIVVVPEGDDFVVYRKLLRTGN